MATTTPIPAAMAVNWYGGGTRRVGTVHRTGHWYKAGEGLRGKFEHLFKDGKPEGPPADEPEESLGPCAARAKDRYVSALEIRHAGKPWEAFQYHGVAVRSEFANATFWVEFADYLMRYRVTASGRNLHRIYTNIRRPAWRGSWPSRRSASTRRTAWRSSTTSR